MSEQQKNEQREITEDVDRAVRSLLDVGRLWASHGLSVGRSALETSAATLRTTAQVLGDLSDRFAEKAKHSDDDAKAA